MASPDRVVIIAFHVTIEVPKVGLVSEIGHAGVLLISGANGATKYFEYGRYDAAGLGIVRTKTIPDVKMDGDNPNPGKLKQTLRIISEQSGKKTAIAAVMYKTEGKFAVGVNYCLQRLAQNMDPKREPYSVTTNNCMSFAMETAKQMLGAIEAFMFMPVFNPVPHTCIRALQTGSLMLPGAHNLEYDHQKDVLS